MNPAGRRRGTRRGWIRGRGVEGTPLHDLHEVACVSAQLPANQTMRRPAPKPNRRRSLPPPALVSSCLAPHIEYHPLPPTPPWDKLRTSSSSAACPGAHHLFRPVLALPRFLGRMEGGGARLTRARASSFGSSWNPRVTWRRVSFVDDDGEDRYSETWMICPCENRMRGWAGLAWETRPTTVASSPAEREGRMNRERQERRKLRQGAVSATSDSLRLISPDPWPTVGLVALRCASRWGKS